MLAKMSQQNNVKASNIASTMEKKRGENFIIEEER
jgi:hypothetical protein